MRVNKGGKMGCLLYSHELPSLTITRRRVWFSDSSSRPVWLPLEERVCSASVLLSSLFVVGVPIRLICLSLASTVNTYDAHM